MCYKKCHVLLCVLNLLSFTIVSPVLVLKVNNLSTLCPTSVSLLQTEVCTDPLFSNKRGAEKLTASYVLLKELCAATGSKSDLG